MDSKRSRRGQSLLEAMVALSILTVGFLGLVALLSKSFFYSREVADKMKATYLASEGVEIVKNLIDHDVTLAVVNKGEGGWGSCFSGQIVTGFEVDYKSGEDYTTQCDHFAPYSASDHLYLDPVTHLYSYDKNGTLTNFTRKIRITQNGDEIIVQSIVNWSTGPITAQSVEMEDHFYNWHP